MEVLEEIPSSFFWISPALAIAVIWRVIQQTKDLSLLLSVNLQIKINVSFILKSSIRVACPLLRLSVPTSTSYSSKYVEPQKTAECIYFTYIPVVQQTSNNTDNIGTHYTIHLVCKRYEIYLGLNKSSFYFSFREKLAGYICNSCRISDTDIISEHQFSISSCTVYLILDLVIFLALCKPVGSLISSL